MLIRPHSAIPSWEGYEYQRHVGIYYTLQEIKELLKNDKGDSIGDYSLVFEGEEDFSIQKLLSKDEGEEDPSTKCNKYEYLSLHQVKNTESLSISNNDKFCFIISVLQYGAKKGYFHINQDTTSLSGFVKATIGELNSLEKQFGQKIKLKFDKVADKDKNEDDYIVLDKLSNTKKGDKYGILEYILNQDNSLNKKNEDDVKKGLKRAKCKINKYKSELQKDNSNSDDNEFFQIFEEQFVSTTEAKKASYSLLSEILEKKDTSWSIGTTSEEERTNYCRSIYGEIILHTQVKISESHEARKKAVAEAKDKLNNCRINFCDIYNLIDIDKTKEKNSVPHQYRMVWKNIFKSFERYPGKNCEYKECEKCSYNVKCNLHKQSKKIKNIGTAVVHEFIYRLILKMPIPDSPYNLPGYGLIDNTLTSLIKESIYMNLDEEKLLLLAQKNGKIYRASLDDSHDVSNLQANLSTFGKKSPDNTLLLYEADILITDRLDEKYAMVDGNNVMVMSENEYGDNDFKEITNNSIEGVKINCNKPKVMRLIDGNKAKEELR